MDIRALAAEFGFTECYVFTTELFVYYERRLESGALHSDAKHVLSDVLTVAPWANTILGLVYPYQPYADGVPLSAYYPSSNAAYHASSKLIRRMAEENMRAVRVELPVRELLTRNGIGIPLKNGLTFLPGYGTRYFLLTMAAELISPIYMKPVFAEKNRCDTCHACEKVCPGQAINDSGYDYRRCARAFMCGEPMEEWVMDAMTSMLGCELCQNVCPYNNDIKPIDALPDAMNPEQLLAGNVKPALEIVGKNQNRQGKLIQHACVIAAHQGRNDLIPLIEPWSEDQREAVRVAADYALRKLRG